MKHTVLVQYKGSRFPFYLNNVSEVIELKTCYLIVSKDSRTIYKKDLELFKIIR